MIFLIFFSLIKLFSQTTSGEWVLKPYKKGSDPIEINLLELIPKTEMAGELHFQYVNKQTNK